MDFINRSEDELVLMMMSADPEIRTGAGLSYFYQKDKALQRGLLGRGYRKDIVEDAVHEGMLNLEKRLRKGVLDKDGSVFGYVFKICVNEAKKRLQKDLRETAVANVFLEPRRGTKHNDVPHYGEHIRELELDQILGEDKEQALKAKRLLFHLPDEHSRMIAFLLRIARRKPGEIALLTQWDKGKIYRVNFRTPKWLESRFPFADAYLGTSSHWEEIMSPLANDDAPINFAVHGIGVNEDSYLPDQRKDFLDFFDCTSFNEFNSQFHVMLRFEESDLTPYILTVTITPVKDFSEVTFYEGEQITYYDFEPEIVRDGRDYLILNPTPYGIYSGIISQPKIRDNYEKWIGIEYRIHFPGGLSLIAKKGISKGFFYLLDPDNPPGLMQITHVYKIYPN